MSSSEDYIRTRELRGRGHMVMPERKKPQKIAKCVVCGCDIPLEDGVACCDRCWAEMNGANVEVKDPMKLFYESRSIYR
jgi:predicted nucleic acid-binding Zn ribbon protein